MRSIPDGPPPAVRSPATAVDEVQPPATPPGGEVTRVIDVRTTQDATATRATAVDDLKSVARLHANALGHGLYPLLGQRFLRVYHAALLDSPHATSAVLGPAGGPTGFVVTLTDPGAHRVWLRTTAARRLALHGAIGLATHPRALALFLRTRIGRYLRALRETDGASSTGTDGRPPPAVLLHVAVARYVRGRGLGRVLVQRSVADARRAGRSRITLVTSADAVAVQVYEALGWTRVGERPGRDGQPVVAFARDTAARP